VNGNHPPQTAGYPAPFDEWGRITRFLESARLAFARERSLWTSLEISDASGIEVSAPADQGYYRVALQRHLEAVGDTEVLFASVLIHSYALAEWAAANHLRRDARDMGGIEDWGGRLLAGTGMAWSRVAGGLPRAAETAVVRNLFAHGSPTVDATSASRLTAAGSKRFRAGTPRSLTYTDLRDYRACLRSLLRLGGVGR